MSIELELIVCGVLIFLVSLIFSMFGKGGGEFYVPIMITLLPITIYEASSVSLFLILIQGISMSYTYHRKHKLIDLKVGLILAIVIGFFAFLGGFMATSISPIYIKLLFSTLLFASALIIFAKKEYLKIPGYLLDRRVGEYEYKVNILAMLIPVAIVAFLAGMVGISGGGLIVPIMIILGGIPFRIAIGTNTILVLIAALMGLLGHTISSGLRWDLAIPFGILVIIGSQLGSRIHILVSENIVRKGLATILALAGVLMLIKAIA